MSSTPVKLLIRGGGLWRQINEEWVYISDQPGHRATVPTTISHSRLVSYVQFRCGIDSSFGITRITYLYSGQLFELNSDETVFSFLDYAASLNYPSTICVCVENSNVQESYVGGIEQNQCAQATTSDFLPEQTYGVNESDFVPDTQQSVQEEEVVVEEAEEDDDDQQEEEDEVEDEDDEHDFEDLDYDDMVDENHVFHLGIPGIDSDEEVIPDTPPITSYAGINDFFGMPPTLTDVIEEPDVVDQTVSYIRSRAISEADVFQTKDEMTIALGFEVSSRGF